MKRLQNKVWAKCLAFVLCLLGAFGTLISCLGMCIVALEPKKSDMLEYCYNAILTSYAYEIIDEMDISDPHWKESLEKYQEKNWSFALIEAEENKLEAMDLDNPVNYEYISGDVLKEEYEFKEETSKYSYYEYNTNSLLSLLFGSTYYEYDDVSYEEKKIQYVVMDESIGVFYVATTEGFIAMETVCVQTEGGLKRDFLHLVTEDNGEVYYALESTGEKQSPEQIRNYNYVSEICNLYEDFPLYWHDGDIAEGDNYKANHIYVLPSNKIHPRYYKADSQIYNYELTEYNYISYSNEHSYIAHVFYGSINDELVYDDEIAQVTRIIEIIYSLAGAYVFFILGSLFVFMAGLSFLIYGAGHRNDSKEIALRVIDRMPLEILTGGVAGIYIGLIFLFILLIDNSYILGDTTIFLSAILFAAAVIVSVVYLISIAVRTKAKRFWKNTIIYFLIEKIVGLCKFIGKNVPLFGKCLLVMVVLGIGETITLLFWWEFYWDFEIQIMVIGSWTLLETVLVFFFCYQMKILQKGIEKVAAGDVHEKVDTSHLFWEFKKHGEMINKARDGIAAAVEKQIKSERFRTELITNVSHDIKTPLTSIINYVDLIQKEELQNEKLIEYVEVLDRQSNRLKKLIEDLMEASKASTGNLPVQMEDCDVSVLLTQLIGEYQEKLVDRNLELVVQSPSESVMIKADGRYLWRVFDNLMNNICKYALAGTRVYVTMEKDTLARITFRNISRQQLNISSEELMERFVRGDSSRNTEGSGLGLSIAQSLTILMNGKMDLFVDGDLFKVILTFPLTPYNNRSHNQFEAQNPSEQIVFVDHQETADEQYNERD